MVKLDKETFRITEPSSLGRNFLIVGIVGLVLSGIALVPSLDLTKQFYFSLLVSWVFWITIGFGGLFFVMVHHLTNSTWSVVIRRFLETSMANLPLIFIIGLLVVIPGLGLGHLYEWSTIDTTDHHAMHESLLHAKSWWLNTNGFLIRFVIYVLITFFLTRRLYKLSIRQDNEGGKTSITDSMKTMSGPGLVLFALTLTLTTFDYIMSLDHLWYSTIIGVYVFAGSVIAILSFTTIVAYFFNSQGQLKETITVEHYHDLGKLIFAFTVFWAYIAFSQFFLIWYGNIPEETDWYVRRFEGTWGNMGFVILFGHFVLPFLVLISRTLKRRPKALVMIAVYMLLMHLIDLHWLIMPNMHHGGFDISWLDVTTFLGIGGIFLYLFWTRLVANAVIPVKDPRLDASIHFTNI